MDSVDAVKQKKLDHLLAEAFYTGGVPFRFIENKYFQQFVTALKPVYTLPSRKALANDILDEVYAKTQKAVGTPIEESKYVNIVYDGWTDINGRAVINFIVMMPHPVFLEAVYTDSERHTDEYLAQKTARIIEKLGPEKVCSIMTDNALATRAAGASCKLSTRKRGLFADVCCTLAESARQGHFPKHFLEEAR